MSVTRLLGELQCEGALSAEQGGRVKEWLCSVEEERSGLTTASGPDSGIEGSSTEDHSALRRAKATNKNQVDFSITHAHINIIHRLTGTHTGPHTHINKYEFVDTVHIVISPHFHTNTY